MDKVKGQGGDDFITVADGDGLDTANGGKGQLFFDECQADPGDVVINCEFP